jgi:DNA polymerase III epsilon subunit-like protein
VLIKPDGWEIEPGAEAVHGISTQTCHRYGVRLAEALILLKGLTGNAARIIAHNMQFDRKVISLAIERAGGTGIWWSGLSAKMLCTMEASTETCAIPKPSGWAGFKFPKLSEAYLTLTGIELQEAHDADKDIEATMAVYRALLERGVIEPPAPFGIAQ